jgi:HEAT repeat protein
MASDILKQLQHNDVKVRQVALKDLLVSDNPSKELLLERMLQRERNVQLKYEVRKALNEVRSLKTNQKHVQPETTQVDSGKLKTMLNSSNEEYIKKAIGFILSNRHNASVPDALAACKRLDTPYYKICAIKLYQLYGSEGFQHILIYLKDEEPRVVSSAIEALAQIGNTNALAAITEYVEHENNRVQATALKALHDLGDKSVFHLFERMIESTHSAYRDSAASAIAALKLDKSIPLLEKLLDDDVESVRQKALNGLESLAKENNPNATKVLDRVMKIKPQLLQGLSELDLDKSMAQQTPVPAALNSDEDQLRIKALNQLGDQGDENAIRAIVDRLKIEKEPKVISSAIIALMRCQGGEKLKIRFFMSYLSHKDDRIRANSIEALASVISEDRLDFFLAYLNDSNNRVIGNAIVALGSAPNFDEAYKSFVINALVDLLQHENENFQLTALYCMGSIQNSDFLALLKEHYAGLSETAKTKCVEMLESWALGSADAKTVLNEVKASTRIDSKSVSAPKIKPPSTNEKPKTEKPKVEKKKQVKKAVKTTSVKKAKPVSKSKTSNYEAPQYFHIAALSAFLIIVGLYAGHRWVLALLSEDKNIYSRLFSCMGLMMCTLWVFAGCFYHRFIKDFPGLLLILFTLDYLFTVMIALVIINSLDVVTGLKYLAYGFTFITYPMAAIYHRKANG